MLQEHNCLIFKICEENCIFIIYDLVRFNTANVSIQGMFNVTLAYTSEFIGVIAFA